MYSVPIKSVKHTGFLNEAFCPIKHLASCRSDVKIQMFSLLILETGFPRNSNLIKKKNDLGIFCRAMPPASEYFLQPVAQQLCNYNRFRPSSPYGNLGLKWVMI